jgi:hypothetical protein
MKLKFTKEELTSSSSFVNVNFISFLLVSVFSKASILHLLGNQHIFALLLYRYTPLHKYRVLFPYINLHISTIDDIAKAILLEIYVNTPTLNFEVQSVSWDYLEWDDE